MKLRKAAKLNQEDAAHQMGLDRGYLSGIENGKRNPSVIQLLKIAQGLGVTPQQLLDYPEATHRDDAEYREKVFFSLMKLDKADQQEVWKLITSIEKR